DVLGVGRAGEQRRGPERHGGATRKAGQKHEWVLEPMTSNASDARHRAGRGQRIDARIDMRFPTSGLTPRTTTRAPRHAPRVARVPDAAPAQAPSGAPRETGRSPMPR